MRWGIVIPKAELHKQDGECLPILEAVIEQDSDVVLSTGDFRCLDEIQSTLVMRQSGSHKAATIQNDGHKEIY